MGAMVITTGIGLVILVWVYFVIRAGAFPHVLITLALLAAVIVGGVGFHHVFDHPEQNDMAGAVLLLVAIGTFTSSSVVIQKYLKSG